MLAAISCIKYSKVYQPQKTFESFVTMVTFQLLMIQTICSHSYLSPVVYGCTVRIATVSNATGQVLRIADKIMEH